MPANKIKIPSSMNSTELSLSKNCSVFAEIIVMRTKDLLIGSRQLKKEIQRDAIFYVSIVECVCNSTNNQSGKQRDVI